MILEKRGPKRPFPWKLLGGGFLFQESLAYLSGTQYMRQLRLRIRDLSGQWWRMSTRRCSTPRLEPTDFETLDNPPPTGQVEHPLPVSVIYLPIYLTFTDASKLFFLSVFVQSANWGRLPQPRYRRVYTEGPSGPPTRNPAIPDGYWRDVWARRSLPAGLPRVSPTSPDIRSPVGRSYERWGSNTNADHFLFLQDAVNAAKGQLEVFKSPMDLKKFRGHLADAVSGSDTDEHSAELLLMPLREVRFSLV